MPISWYKRTTFGVYSAFQFKFSGPAHFPAGSAVADGFGTGYLVPGTRYLCTALVAVHRCLFELCTAFVAVRRCLLVKQLPKTAISQMGHVPKIPGRDFCGKNT